MGSSHIAGTGSTDAVRARLDQLRTLDPPQAVEVEQIWPLTLASLDVPTDQLILGLPAWRMQDVLARELDERISDAKRETEAAA